MKFKEKNLVKGRIFSFNFLENVRCLIFSKNVIHHTYITGEIVGYVHSSCNQKVRENKNQITYLDLIFFFFLKGLKQGVWRTRNFSIGGTNLTNVNFANIIDQIKFIDTLKYYQ